MKRIQTYSDYILHLDYREKPRTVDQILDDPAFFGKLTASGKAIYPVWRDTLNELIREDSKWVAAFTGAIGTGKSRTAILGVGIIMHIVLCLKDPWDYFELMAGGKLAIAFFNLTQTLSKSKGYSLLQSYLLNSTWFCDRGTEIGVTDRRVEFPLFEYLLASPYSRGFSITGEDVFLALLDELDSPTESINQKMRVMQMYNEASRRFESRFVRDNEALGKLFLVASKKSELSFLNIFIDKMKNSPEVYIKDIPLWEAKPDSMYSGETFSVMMGDVYVPPKIVEGKEDKRKALESGYEILEVPVEYKRTFARDIIGALRDIAGRAIEGERKTKLFPSRKSIIECFDTTKEDPVKMSTINIGLKDNIDLLKFIDLSKIRIPKEVSRSIHEDIAFTGDALSIAMSCIKTWKDINKETEEGTFIVQRLPVVETDFVLRIKAKPGDRIPLSAVRKLVIDLKKIVGYNIVEFTADLRLASEDTMQILERAGIPCKWLSLDKKPEFYLNFRDLVYEQRWVCHPHNYLNFELVNLEIDPTNGKIVHPDEVKDIEFLEDGTSQEVILVGSKDVADAVVGSVVGVIVNSHAPMDVASMSRLLHSIVTDAPETTEDVVRKFTMMGIERVHKKSVKKDEKKILEGDVQTFANLLKDMTR